MLPDRVSNPGPLTYESGALPIALRGPALILATAHSDKSLHPVWVGLTLKEQTTFINIFSLFFRENKT